MIFTTLRQLSSPQWRGGGSAVLVCSDTNFQTALELVKILIQHAAKVFSDLPAEQEVSKRENKKQRFLEALPPEFSRQIYVNIAQTLEIPDRTAKKYIAKFKQNGFINHISHGNYRKR
jgi:nitrogenase subunit NifH